ncbi:RluA family pseudouridine synthase [Aquiluna sp.]|nr:RluA family pseudouridine synthase [Aquiluna sp.]MDA7799178.1 RluA family pseudouridine synthase [Aquiluna sp.]MDA9010437.1 RluA family pseudouridine synthase [Aquiluna sp.]MDB4018341.1 RluA family pseudouridine synthase [Aquiluna sp.]
MQPKFLPVPPDMAGLRADAGIAKMLGMSRTQIAELIQAGSVLQNGNPMGKSDRLVADTLLEIQLTETRASIEVTAEDVEALSVVFQDDHMVVIDKPTGVVSHPSQGFVGPSVPGVLLARGIQLTTSGAQERQGIVQRLDVGTSGLMVLAKSEAAYSNLKQAFRDRVVKKTYHALVQGHPDPSNGTIDTPIARSTKHDYKFTISAEGKPAVTHYETLELLPAAALVKVGLETGRTHQIRVHFAHFRHPLVGDPLYGADPKLASALNLNRQWLHAKKLGFDHPISGEFVEFESDYPVDLEIALNRLRDVNFRL